ncbi:MAG: peptidoglycan DD-metalloendopeptidase family protein [Sphingobacteriales bacterium]|nr:peptidoglycan DD-metalloendopeptidase family protein [Sphingobacteriales bacterium]MBI3717041.1 peptidoglycan DD-metalloendopeptidase family protein [Sphingobacteriales bacterium]
MKRIIITFFSLLLLQASFAQQPKGQDKQELERKRQETLREIDEINANLKEIQKNKKQGIAAQALANKKLVLRQRVINTINDQIHVIDDDIYKNNREVYRLKNDLDTLKQEYAKSIVYAYKSRSSFDFLNFIFSANSFNDAIRRIAYLRTYRSYRAQQAETIKKTQDQINEKLGLLKANKQKKGESLQDQNKEAEKLAQEKQEKDQIVSRFKSQEKELGAVVANKKKQLANYKKQIDAIVRREVKEAQEKARLERERLAKLEKEKEKTNPVTAVVPKSENKASAPKSKPVVEKKAIDFNLSEADYALASEFRGNQNRLPWPVDNGYLTAHFGDNVIEGTKIHWNSSGITISTNTNANVKAIFDGEVASVFNVEGNYGVIIRHGNYYTTYGNLGSVSVAKNAIVKAGQAIGRAGDSDSEDGRGQVEFMVMKETSYLNPESWLRDRH